MTSTAANENSALLLFPEKYRTGMWVVLASIMMLFTALSSAYIVRASGANDWTPLDPPRLLWLSTTLILLSSLSFELARKALKRNEQQKYARWLLVTVLLGLGFLGAQFLAWRELVAQGLYLASNPHSSFFYLLTALHGLHLLGGILALDYLLLHAWRRRAPAQIGIKRAVAAGAVAIYWHFMGALWIYLFLLLFLWR
ncbi:MAG TPA: cytochrome c oxidase subunit 3 [Pyrinomonadaceae bacterium]|jgi:cytochrome c oxidase subunit 3